MVFSVEYGQTWLVLEHPAERKHNQQLRHKRTHESLPAPCSQVHSVIGSMRLRAERPGSLRARQHRASGLASKAESRAVAKETFSVAQSLLGSAAANTAL